MNKQDKKVPTLRFKGFTNDWEQHKLGDITIPIKTYPYTRKYETKNITKFKYIHYGDIHTGKAKKINEPSKLPSITKGNYSTLRNGDVVVADASEDYKGIADAAILLSTGAFSIIAGLHTIAFRPNRKLVFPMFIYYNLQTSRFKHYGYHVGTGLKVFGISSNLFFDYSAFHPSLIEQQEISKLIESLENLLSLQQRKLDLLKQLKKGLLQKMFADKGSKRPILRFNGFTDDWEERKLGDIALFSKGKGISKKDLHTHGIYNIVHYADIYKFMPVQDKVLHHSNNKMGVRIGSNSLLFAGSDVTPKGLARTTAIKQENVRVGGDVIIADLSEKHINYFMSYEINMNKRFIYPFITGSTVRHIHGSDLSHLNITFPSLSEQKSIAHIFNLIEHELSLLKIKKSKYQSIKKSLLQQMFI